MDLACTKYSGEARTNELDLAKQDELFVIADVDENLYQKIVDAASINVVVCLDTILCLRTKVWRCRGVYCLLVAYTSFTRTRNICCVHIWLQSAYDWVTETHANHA